MDKKTKKSVLVTGCGGFIGSNFTKTFLKKFPELNVIGIDDFSTGRKEAVQKGVTFYKESILNTKKLEEIFSKHKPICVFHFAALPRVSYSVEQPVKTNEVNINGTTNLLEMSRKYGTKRFVFSTSSSVFGGAKNMPTKEEERKDPKSPYALQKLAGEYFCKMWSEIYGLETVCLRYFNVFGPGQYGDSAYSTVVSAWLESLYFPKNKKAFLEGDGSQSRDFCFVDNVVEANILAMQTKKFGKEKFLDFNIGNGKRTTLLQVKKMIEKETGKKIELEKRPARIGDVKHTKADIRKAKKILGYRPKYEFKEGLKETIKWFEKRVK